MGRAVHMEKILSILALFLFFFAFTPASEGASAKKLNVFVNCDANYSTVQSALNGLTGPATIIVSGTCTENLQITKDDVTITGATSATTIQPADLDLPTILVQGASRVALSNMIVEGDSAGVSEVIGSSVIINNCTIRNASVGVNVMDSAALILANSTITGNGTGVLVHNSGSARIGVNVAGQSGPNTITGNSKEGIRVANGGAAYIHSNTISGNQTGVAINHATARLLGGNTITGNGGTDPNNPGYGVAVRQGVLLQGAGDYPLQDAPSRDTISGNNFSGLFAWNGSSLDIQYATINGNLGNGIVLSLHSTMRILSPTPTPTSTPTSTVGDNTHDGIYVELGSAVRFGLPAASVTANNGFGLRCADTESHYSANNVSGIITGNAEGNIQCTPFTPFPTSP